MGISTIVCAAHAAHERETNKLCFAIFQTPSQKASGKGLEVNVKHSYKEQLTEHGHILQQSYV